MWVGIDPSLTGTAIAAVDASGLVEVRTHVTTGHKGASHRSTLQRLTRIERWVRDRLDALCLNAAVAGIALEGPSLAPHRMGSDHERAGLWWRLYTRASMYAAVTVITPKQRAKYATGSGNAGKDAVILGVCRRWPDFAGGNDEADAVTLAAMIARLDGHPVDGRIPKPCLAALDKLAVRHG